MKHYPLRAPASPAQVHDAAIELADKITARLNKAAPRHPGWPIRVRDKKPFAVQRAAAITLSLALVEEMLRDGTIVPGELLGRVEK